MSDFSNELRTARESRRIGLEEISGVTKISRRHLEALEAGEFSALPGGVFRKGILRAYLGAVGLEPEPWVQRYEGLLAAAGQSAMPAVDLQQIAEGVQRSRGFPERTEGTRWPGVFAMMALLLVFCWCVWHFALRGHVLVSSLPGWPALGHRLHQLLSLS